MPKDWTELGQITVKANVLSVDVGSFSIDQDDDTIWLDIRQVSPVSPWPWSYGIVKWQTSAGNELGSTKAYTETAGEFLRLGIGRAPSQLTGSIIYEPRSFNLAWVKNDRPLTLSFRVCSGVSSSGSSSGGFAVAFPVIEDGIDRGWKYAVETGLAQLLLN